MKTKIEWADKVWNPVTGCTRVSEGCRHCYAERMARRLRGRCGYPADNPFRVTLHPERLAVPLRWRKPSRVFVCSMGDLFHPDVPFEYIDKVFKVIDQCRQHTFLILTKRPRALYGYCKQGEPGVFPYKNVWLGVSVEDQATADERIPLLLQIPAARRFVSYEPALEFVNFEKEVLSYFVKGGYPFPSLENKYRTKIIDTIDWLIMGGETGPGARPMHPDWVRSVRDQCQAAGVPFFFKQWGEWAPDCLCDTYKVHKSTPRPQPGGRMGGMFRCGRKAAGALIDGREWREVPK